MRTPAQFPVIAKVYACFIGARVCICSPCRNVTPVAPSLLPQSAPPQRPLPPPRLPSYPLIYFISPPPLPPATAHLRNSFFDRNAKSLIKKLLVADLTKRYGCLKNGAEDLKKHKWFASFSFPELLARTKVAPLVPEVKNESDTSNFDPYPDSTEAPPKVGDDQQSLFAEF